MRYDAVIFDLDGTLTDSAEGILRSVDYAVEALGCKALPRGETRRFIGPPLRQSFALCEGIGDARADEAVVKYRERYSTIGWAENRVYEGIPAMLKALKRAGVWLGVATAKPEVYARKVLERFRLLPWFDVVCGVRLDDFSDDKSQLIRRALPPSFRNACMVGDRRYDIAAARSVGIDAVGALYGYGTRDELREAGATDIADTPDMLADILLEGLPREPGRFFSFEGSDGCGKTTQRNILADWLKTCGWRVKMTREPGGGPISEQIRQLVLNPAHREMVRECEAYLFAAARSQHVRDTIRPALEVGEVVLCDRYLDSSVAFQGAGRGLGEETVRALNAMAVGNLLPDATFWLDVDPIVALGRRLACSEPDRIETERQDFVQRVYAAYERIAAREPERFLRIDASGTIDDIQDAVRMAAFTILEK